MCMGIPHTPLSTDIHPLVQNVACKAPHEYFYIKTWFLWEIVAITGKKTGRVDVNKNIAGYCCEPQGQRESMLLSPSHAMAT